MPQFVLLEHTHPVLHWDFMLEKSGVLQTWRLAELPSESPVEIEATQLPDHRLAYLDYEGPVSHNRGNVRRIDRGTYERIESEGQDSRRVVEVTLSGVRIAGRAVLQQIDGEAWSFTWQPLRR